jgi:hypothetical protein
MSEFREKSFLFSGVKMQIKEKITFDPQKRIFGKTLFRTKNFFCKGRS